MSKFHIEDDNEPMEREGKNHGGLDDWFKKEKWVRVDAPKKKGKYQPCGRADTSKGKKPVCVPVNKAKNLSFSIKDIFSDSIFDIIALPLSLAEFSSF